MGRWTYYMPLWGGTLLAVLLAVGNWDKAPDRPMGVLVAVTIALSLLFGIACQVVMLGAQGTFAQVLPVPRGRSIRGRAAILGGALLLCWTGFAVVGTVLWNGGLTVPGTVFAGLAVASLVVFAAVYFWSIPAAVHDFDERDPTGP